MRPDPSGNRATGSSRRSLAAILSLLLAVGAAWGGCRREGGPAPEAGANAPTGAAAGAKAPLPPGPREPSGPPGGSRAPQGIWPLPNGPGNRNRSEFVGAVPGEVLWIVPLDHYVSGPVIDPEGNLYCGTNNGKLASVSPDGRVRWVHESEYNFSRPTLVGRDRVAAARADGALVCLSREGGELWAFQGGEACPEGASAGPGPAVDAKGDLYFVPARRSRGGGKPQVFCLTPEGSVKWSFEIDRADPPGADVRWRLPASCSPVLAGPASRVFFSAPDDAVYCLSDDGRRIWKRAVPDLDTDCAPCSYGPDGVLAGSRKGKILNLAPDGGLVWEFDASALFLPPGGGAPGSGTPMYLVQSLAVREDGAIVAGVARRDPGISDGFVIGVSPDGALLWKYPASDGLCGDLAIDAAGKVYFGIYVDYSLHCLDPGGRLLRRMEFRDGVFSPVIGRDGTVYVGTGCCERGIYAIGPRK